MRTLGILNLIVATFILILLKLQKYTLLFYAIIILYIINIVFLFVKHKEKERIKCRLIDWDFFINNFDNLEIGAAGFVFVKLYGVDSYLQEFGKAGYDDYFHFIIKFLSKTLREQDIIVKINNYKILLVLKDIPLSIFSERVNRLYYSVRNNTVLKYRFFLKGLDKPELETIFNLDAEVEKISRIKKDSNLIIL